MTTTSARCIAQRAKRQTERTARAYDAAIAYAANLGAQDGKAAGTWYELPDGSRSRYDARALHAILDGIENDDPAVLDTLPSPDLSGQWADSLTGPMLEADALAESGILSDNADGRFEAAQNHPTLFSDICDAYEMAFSQAAEDEIVRAARYQLED